MFLRNKFAGTSNDKKLTSLEWRLPVYLLSIGDANFSDTLM